MEENKSFRESVKIKEEQLKYLIISDLGKNYDLISINFLFDYNKTGTRIDEYDIDIKFDYQGAIDADYNDFLDAVSRVVRHTSDVIANYIITPEGKLKSYNSLVNKPLVVGPTVWSMDFAYDTKHFFEIGVKIDHIS